MTSASACEHMWSIEGWIHNKRRNRLAQPNVKKAVRAHGNLVLRKAILLSRQQKVAWDSQTRISEPDRHTNEQGVDDSDGDDIESDATLIELVVGFSLSHNEECIETVTMHKYSIY